MLSLYKKLEKNNATVIFGASDLGDILYKEIAPYCADTGKPICFADNSYKKWDEQKKILKPADAAAQFPDALWIIASDRHSDTMAEDIAKLGVDKKNVIKELPADILYKKQEMARLKRLSSQGTLFRFDIEIAYHCNLNCAGCATNSPLITRPLYLDVDIFDRDLARISFLLHGILGQLNISGGEPLLNTHINEFVRIARKHFPKTEINVTTNGILLPKMGEAFWIACKNNHVGVSVTRYPIDFDYQIIHSLAEQYGVKFEYSGIAVDKTTWNMAFDSSGSQNPYESFSNCYYANFCVRLQEGKLVTCPLVLNSRYLNEYFGTDFTSCPDDYIDIYEAKSGHELLDFISKPIPFCRFCNVKKRTHDDTWHISKRIEEEWIV